MECVPPNLRIAYAARGAEFPCLAMTVTAGLDDLDDAASTPKMIVRPVPGAAVEAELLVYRGPGSAW